MSHEAPKYYPTDVRKKALRGSYNWEDSGINSRLDFKLLDAELRQIGVDIRKSKVLEVGSGTGKALQEMDGVQKIDVVGVDTRPRGYIERGITAAARIEQLPFPNETFDIVTSTAVFDDLVYDQDQEAMIAEITRVLKHGGIFASICTIIMPPSGSLALLSGSEGEHIYLFKKP